MSLIERAERIVQAAKPPVTSVTRERRAVSKRLADVQPEQVSWLWRGYIPLGKMTVIDGDPGNGKSTLTIDLAARVTTASLMPDRSRSDLDEPADVILLSAEDGAADTIRPRADAAGADARRVHLLTDVRYYDDEGNRQLRPWMLPGDLEALKELIEDEDVKLVVVDPLNAFLDGKVNSYNDHDVRGALRPLAEIAESTSAAVVIVRHLSKSGGANALYRGGGSIGIIGAARSGLLVAKDPDDESERTRVLAVTKSNISEPASAMRYELASDEIHGCARVRWLGESSHTATALLAIPSSEDDRSEQSEIAALLVDWTADGIPLEVEEARKRLRAAGYSPSETTMRRARDRAGLTTTKPASFGGRRSYVRQGRQPDSPVTPSSPVTDGTGGGTGASRENVSQHSSPATCLEVAGLDGEGRHALTEWRALTLERLGDLAIDSPAWDEMKTAKLDGDPDAWTADDLDAIDAILRPLEERP